MKIPNRLRDCSFSMRMREHEVALLEAKKDEADMTKSEYLRNIILFAPACERPRFSSDFAEEMRKKMNAIGGVVNEIARATNGRQKITPTDMNVLKDEFIRLFTLYDEFVRDNVENPY